MDQAAPNRAIIALKEKKIGARIFCTNLFLTNHDQEVLYLTGFGPAQEVRAFAQLLSKKPEMRVSTEDGNELVKVFDAHTDNQIWIAKGPEGQSLIYSVPRHTELIFAASEDEGRVIFERLLSQQQFVLKAWFPQLFAELPRLMPHVGSMFGCIPHRDIEARVKEGIASGEFIFPTPRTRLNLQTAESKDETRAA